MYQSQSKDWSALELKALTASIVRPSLTFHIFHFSSETYEQNLTELYRKQVLNILYQVRVFRANWKSKIAALASCRLLLCNRWTELTKLDRKQVLKILYHVCVIQADRRTKNVVLTSDWLRQFLLLICNCWTEFEERKQVLNFVYRIPLGRGCSEKKDGRPGIWLTGAFLLLPCNPWTEFIVTKSDRKQELNVLYQVCGFLGPIGN